jgi:VWFA-related protein
MRGPGFHASTKSRGRRLPVRFLAILGLLLVGGIGSGWAAAGLKVHLGQVEKGDFPAIKLFVELEEAGGKPTKLLGKADFQVYEDQKLVTVQEFFDPTRAGPLATILVLDCSGSMGKAGKMTGLKAAATSYVQYMKTGDRTGIVAFDSRVRKLSPLTADKNLLTSHLASLYPNDRTAFLDALYAAAEMLDKVKGRKVILAITDGMDNCSSKTPEQVVEISRKYGIPVYNIGLGQRGVSLALEDGINEPALSQLAEQTGGLYFFAPAANELTGIYENLSRQFHGGYQIGYTSPNPLQDGTTRVVEVKVAAPEDSGEGRNSYYIPGVVVPIPNTLIFICLLLPLIFLVMAPSWLRRRRPEPAVVPIKATPEPTPDLVPKSREPVAARAAAPPRTDAPRYLSLAPLARESGLPSFPLRQGENSIGAAPSNDVVIVHPSVSPTHARITWEDNQYIIADLNSAQGTFVSFSGDPDRERRLGQSALKVGSVIRFGQVYFRIKE